MAYFHIRLSVAGEKSDEVKLDLSEAELEMQFLAPYRAGDPITVNGRSVPPAGLERLRISRSEQPAESFRAVLEAEDRESSFVFIGGPSMRWRMAARAPDVTDQYVLGPPGFEVARSGAARSAERESDGTDEMAYTAAACKAGHLIASDVVDPEHRQRLRGRAGLTPPQSEEVGRYCGRCGAPVLTKCESCQRPIPAPVSWGEHAHKLVSFCPGCGRAFPWATREERIHQLYNLLDFEDGLEEAERLQVIEAIAALSEPEQEEDDERLIRAGETFKRLAPKAWATATPVLQGVLQAWLKKSLGLS